MNRLTIHCDGISDKETCGSRPSHYEDGEYIRRTGREGEGDGVAAAGEDEVVDGVGVDGEGEGEGRGEEGEGEESFAHQGIPFDIRYLVKAVGPGRS